MKPEGQNAGRPLKELLLKKKKVLIVVDHLELWVQKVYVFLVE